MRPLSSLARWLLGDYSLYTIYSLSANDCAEPEICGWVVRPIEGIEEFARASDPSIRSLASYAVGGESFGFGAWVDGELAAACWFWAGETYKRRNFWPLQADEAKLVQITTAPRFRGWGIAPKLIAFAASRMKELGYRRLFARIWHSNRSSISAFEKAGWKKIAFVVEISPFGKKKPIRLLRRWSA